MARMEDDIYYDLGPSLVRLQQEMGHIVILWLQKLSGAS